jgi:hypothetical protein
MTVTVKDRVPLVVPPADQIEDSREVGDSKVRAHIRASHAEFLAGRSRPAETFLAQRVSREKGRRGGKRHPRL